MAVSVNMIGLFVLWGLAACQSGRSSHLLDIEKSDEREDSSWDEFTDVPSIIDDPRLKVTSTRSLRKAPRRNENLGRSLASLANLYSIERPKKFGAGVVGRHGDVVVYAANWSSLQHSEDRMYWDLVRVLSQRYGCLMRERRKSFQAYAFRCKDRRTVQLSYYKYPDHVVILGTQMDRYGRQLIVQR